MTVAVQGVFDEPAIWRASIIDELRLRGEDRQAAASPAPGLPQLSALLVAALAHAPRGPIIDVGGGLGGLTDHLDRSTARTCVLVEPSECSVDAAAQLFPSIAITRARADTLPVRSNSCGGLVLCGVVSLMVEVESWMREAHRVLRTGGVLFVADLWSSSTTPIDRPPNRFWSIEVLSWHAARSGFVRRDLAVCDPTVGSWSSAGSLVAERLRRRHRLDEALTAWTEDQRHLDEVISSGEVVAGGVTFLRRSGS